MTSAAPSPRPHRPRSTARRRLPLVLVGALLAVGGGVPPALGAPRTHPAPDPIRVVLDRLDPKAAAPGTLLRIAGQLENVGRDELADLRVRLRVETRAVGNRSELAALARRRDPLGALVPDGSVDAAQALRPGRRVRWSLTAPTDELGFGGFGVHAIQLEVRGRPAGRGVRTLGRIMTFLPWAPATSRPAPTGVVWLWPVAATPRQRPDGTFLDDDLAGQVAAPGRLRRLIAAVPAAPGAPVTWVVDPALLRSAADMGDGYLVQPRGHPARAGSGAADARVWLAELRRRTQAGAVLALPYADPDVVALDRVGMDADLGYQTRAGRQITAQLLGISPVEGLAWPPGGLVTPGALEALVGAGTRSLVLADKTLPPVDPPPYTPDARTDVTTVAGTLPTVLADSTLTATLGAARTADDTRLVEQRFLAETALITAELPGRSRTVVVAPPRHWNPPASLARNLLADTATMPWLAATTLSAVLASPAPDAAALTRRGPRYPDEAAADELDAAQLAGVASLARDVRPLRAILVGTGPLGTELLFARFRAESAAWRENPGAGSRLLRATRAAVDDLRGGVSIASAGLFTLTSRTGPVPLTVSNELEESVRVRIALRPRNRAALSAPDVTTVTIAARQKPTIPLSVTAHVNGVIPVTAQLMTPDDQPLSPPVTLRIRSTAYATVGLTVTLGAFAVLLIAVSVRLIRRALRAAARRGGG